MKPKIYIDGREGTTGLQIYERLGARDDIELLFIAEDKRKDTEERCKFLNAADIVFLCLPDAAAKEAVALIDHPKVRVIDASTAHRTASDWTYGFPEMRKGQRERIRNAQRVANPGCHATGFLSLTTPLVQMGILPPDSVVTCFSLTGYSGGGKKRIAEYESAERPVMLDAPCVYGLNLQHKHVPEMMLFSGLQHAPVFCPILADYYKGMSTTLMLQNRQLQNAPTAQQIHNQLAAYYQDETLVSVQPFGTEPSMLSGNAMAGRDSLSIIVCGHETQTILTAQFDNLGKGASGAAVQNMNLLLGLPETTGLRL